MSASRTCRYGRKCRRDNCHFEHPSGKEMEEYCRYDRQCTRPDCAFMHPGGRVIDEEGGAATTTSPPSSKRYNSRAYTSATNSAVTSDEWHPNSRNCTCCKGFIYACSDSTCAEAGRCLQCISTTEGAPSELSADYSEGSIDFDEYDEDPSGAEGSDVHPDTWFPSSMNCTCCQGFVYGCRDDTCASLGMCVCMAGQIEDELTITANGGSPSAPHVPKAEAVSSA